MKLENLIKQIGSAKEKIQEMITGTEDIFAYVYRQLPAIEKEIELTMAETAVLLEYFLPAAAPEASGHLPEQAGRENDMPGLYQVLRRIEDSFAGTSEKLIGEGEMRRSLTLFMGAERGREAGVKELLELIAQVKERLTEIEIISLNAIIYAAHLGDEGRAFGVISDNINSLSNRVREEYSLLQADAQSLSAWNDQFLDGFQGILACHEDLAIKQQEGFKELFNITIESLETISSLMQNLMDNIKSAVEPVQEVMVSIQSQDIIRQSMENLNKCLAAVNENAGSFAAGRREGIDILQLLYFISGALDLSIKLADNIEGELAASLSHLESILADIVWRLGELQDEGSLLAGFLGGGTDGKEGENVVGFLFQRVQSFMDDFTSGVNNMQGQIDGFSGSNKSFYEHMSRLEKRIEAIREHVNFLKKLGLMTRIELARLTGVNGYFEQEISAITERVIADVGSNEALITSLKKRLHGDLLNFEKLLAENRDRAGVMLDVIVQARENLDQVEKLISSAVQSLGQSCGNLIAEVEKARAFLEQNRQLPATLLDIKKTLSELAAEVELARDEALQASGLDEWEGTTREMEELLCGLTTYLERLTASEVFSGLDVDVGSETGDLTLF